MANTIPLGQPGASDWWNSYNNPSSAASLDRQFKELLGGAQNTFQPVQDAYGNTITAQRQLNSADNEDLKRRLKENAGYAISSSNENRNRLGLLQSGGTDAATGLIGRDLAANLNKSDIQTALNDADLVLKQAGFNADLGSQTLNRANQMAGGVQGARTFGLQQQQFDAGQAGELQKLLLNPLLHNIPIDALMQIVRSYGYGGGL